MHTGIETEVFPTSWLPALQGLILISWALRGCVRSCVKGSGTHTRGYTLSREIRLNHSTRRIISSIFKLIFNTVYVSRVRSCPLESISHLPDCLHPYHSPLSLPHRYLYISHGLRLTQSKAYVLTQVSNVVQLILKHKWVLPDLASLLCGPHFIRHISVEVQVCPSSFSFWLWKMLMNPGGTAAWCWWQVTCLPSTIRHVYRWQRPTSKQAALLEQLQDHGKLVTLSPLLPDGEVWTALGRHHQVWWHFTLTPQWHWRTSILLLLSE